MRQEKVINVRRSTTVMKYEAEDRSAWRESTRKKVAKTCCIPK